MAMPENPRLHVFVVVLLGALTVGWGYTFGRPPVYRSEASIAISDPAPRHVVLPPSAPGSAPTAAPRDAGEAASLQGETRRLLGRPVLFALREALRGRLPDELTSFESLQRMLEATPLPAGNIIELSAEGRPAEALPIVLEAWIDAFVAERTSRGVAEGSSERAEAEAQLRSFEQRLAEKRRQLEEFRSAHDIVSLEREENEVSARIKGLNTSHAEATKKQAELQARAEAMQRDIATGKTVVRREDRGDITGMENRARELREQLREAERSYTPQYMRLDPRLRAAQDNLEAIEKRMVEQRAVSQREALAEAEQDLASATRTTASLQQQLEESRAAAVRFNARFAEHKALVAELEQLEALQRQTQNRLVQAELDQASRLPRVTVVAPPSLPESHIRPHYARDAAASLGAALVLALLTVWLVEFLRRPPARAEAPSPLVHIALPYGERADAFARSLPAAPTLALPAAPARGRELAPADAAALWTAADAAGRLVVAGLLGGLAPAELSRLRWEDIDLAAGSCRVAGPAGRILPLGAACRAALEALSPATTGPVLATRDGAALIEADLAGLVAAAAHDAGLASPGDVSPETLRHTYVAFLVRQGARFADLGHIVGDIPPSAFVVYGPMSPPGPGRPLEQVATEYPLPA